MVVAEANAYGHGAIGLAAIQAARGLGSRAWKKATNYGARASRWRPSSSSAARDRHPQVPLHERVSLRRPCAAEDEDGRHNARAPQFVAFFQARDPEAPRAGLIAARPVSMAP